MLLEPRFLFKPRLFLLFFSQVFPAFMLTQTVTCLRDQFIWGNSLTESSFHLWDPTAQEEKPFLQFPSH